MKIKRIYNQNIANYFLWDVINLSWNFSSESCFFKAERKLELVSPQLGLTMQN